ncbi:MAG: Nramp family divalent metal transporter [Candidatus Omnitrophica bacterium]|nr:Nramp family divalent metal transporter [Candidatus Omnitrophota bacterium]
MRRWAVLSSGNKLDKSHQEQLNEKGVVQIPVGAGFWRKFLAFFGPGLLIAVGYMDPGNWATDLAAGAQFGYTLLAVVFFSNLLAVLFQYLALKLGIATGQDLAQACRKRYSRPVTIFLWILCEIAIIACDLAEVIGSAVALNLLFGLPLIAGIIITGMDSFVILILQSRGFRYLEAVVGGLMMIIAGVFIYELVVARPEWAGVAAGLLPKAEIITNPAMLYLSIGILGATVMPHNLYLHSSIVQTRAFRQDDDGRAMAIKFATLDTAISLGLAVFINAAILVLSAAAFHGTVNQNVADISDAYRLLAPTLGATLASLLFAVALLASGQSSTMTGTLAGQIVMEGFLDIRLRPWVRRIITRSLAIIPAVCVAVWMGSRGVGKMLVLSQVILSFQLSFAVIPLVLFTSDKKLMGRFVNGAWIRGLAWAASGLIVVLNLYLIIQAVKNV